MSAAAEAISRLGQILGVELAQSGTGLRVGDRTIPAPEEWEDLDLRSAFPSTAHGDQREKLFYIAVQDASSGPPPERTDHEFHSQLEQLLPVPDERARRVLASAMHGTYWVTPEKRPFLLPYHSILPLSYNHSRADRGTGIYQASRYRLFRGVILPFLCWTGSAVDGGLVGDVLAVFNGQDGFTLLDQLMLEAARAQAGAEPQASAASLESKLRGDALQALREGPFCQPALDLFQRDLRTVLAMPLPRRDLLDALTALLSLHLALLFYRVAVVLDQEVERAIAASGGLDDPHPGCDCSGGLGRCPLAGALKFRTGARGYRPASLREPCTTSYREIDGRRLLALPANIIAANLAQHIWTHLGGPAPAAPQPRQLAGALRADPALARDFDAAAAAMAILYMGSGRGQAPTADEMVEAAGRRPGLYALREVILASRRGRLKHTSRDVVNQLAKRAFGGSLIRSNGTRVTFFELDEDYLFLLVKLICREDELPYDRFLAELESYGLAPQDVDERDRLAAALEAMGMLTRYSDAGESTYVRHLL